MQQSLTGRGNNVIWVLIVPYWSIWIIGASKIVHDTFIANYWPPPLCDDMTLAQESISPTYYLQLLRRYFCAKKVQTLNLSTKKLCAKLSYEKAARKMLVKLTTGQHLSLPPKESSNLLYLWCSNDKVKSKNYLSYVYS